MHQHQVDRLIEAVQKKQNPTVVGLDTRFEYIPGAKLIDSKDPLEISEYICSQIFDYNAALIDALQDIVPAVKIQIAYYEMLGVAGMKLFSKTKNYASSAGLVVITDAKRGDIGATAEAYAQAFLNQSDNSDCKRPNDVRNHPDNDRNHSNNAHNHSDNACNHFNDSYNNSDNSRKQSENVDCKRPNDVRNHSDNALNRTNDGCNRSDNIHNHTDSNCNHCDNSSGHAMDFESDMLTVNPYFGTDGVSPFIDACQKSGKGLFILVKTSNPSGGEFQDLICDGRPLYMFVADKVIQWGETTIGEHGYSSVGAVVGATYPQQGAELRKHMPNCYFLVPGYGAQGATGKDLSLCFDDRGHGAVVNASRSLLCAHKKQPGISFKDAARNEALSMQQDLLAAIGGKIG